MRGEINAGEETSAAAGIVEGIGLTGAVKWIAQLDTLSAEIVSSMGILQECADVLQHVFVESSKIEDTSSDD